MGDAKLEWEEEGEKQKGISSGVGNPNHGTLGTKLTLPQREQGTGQGDERRGSLYVIVRGEDTR